MLLFWCLCSCQELSIHIEMWPSALKLSFHFWLLSGYWGRSRAKVIFFLSMQTFIYPFGSFSHFYDVKGHGNPNDNKIFCFSRSSLYFVFHAEIRAPNIQTSSSLFTVILNQITKYPMVRPGLIKKFNVLSHIYVF